MCLHVSSRASGYFELSSYFPQERFDLTQLVEETKQTCERGKNSDKTERRIEAQEPRAKLHRTWLTDGVEVIVTRPEAQLRSKRREEVEHRPRYNHHVVNGDQRYDDQVAVTDSAENWCDAAEGLVGSLSWVLPDDQLAQEYRHPHDEEHDDVSQKKSTCDEGAEELQNFVDLVDVFLASLLFSFWRIYF